MLQLRLGQGPARHRRAHPGVDRPGAVEEAVEHRAAVEGGGDRAAQALVVVGRERREEAHAVELGERRARLAELWKAALQLPGRPKPDHCGVELPRAKVRLHLVGRARLHRGDAVEEWPVLRPVPRGVAHGAREGSLGPLEPAERSAADLPIRPEAALEFGGYHEALGRREAVQRARERYSGPHRERAFVARLHGLNLRTNGPCAGRRYRPAVGARYSGPRRSR